jgi:hypothetical protein
VIVTDAPKPDRAAKMRELRRRRREERVARGEVVRGRGRPIEQPCGTAAGRERHRQRGEEICDDCKKAFSDAQKEYRKRKKAATSE